MRGESYENTKVTEKAGRERKGRETSARRFALSCARYLRLGATDACPRTRILKATRLHSAGLRVYIAIARPILPPRVPATSIFEERNGSRQEKKGREDGERESSKQRRMIGNGRACFLWPLIPACFSAAKYMHCVCVSRLIPYDKARCEIITKRKGDLHEVTR